MLHLIFSAPLDTTLLQRIGSDDAVLFLENAVLYLLKNSKNHLSIKKILTTQRLFVLVSDIETRGISHAELIPEVSIIDYSDWVNLTTQHPKVQSWI
jgi:tRNA 2-thiouridine synthesizing protein B